VPAVIGYNWLIRRNKAAQEDLSNFTSDLHAYLVSGARVATPVAAPAAAAAPKK
jgi:biopolymer transport protein ExbB